MSQSAHALRPPERLVPQRAVPDDLDAHLAAFGPRPATDAAVLIEALDQSGLRGRGGADFPTVNKWRGVVENTHRGGNAVVIANAAECEPASLKDHYLLTYRPHLVLDGLEHAAEAIGAQRMVIYTTRAHRDLEASLRVAIRERARRDDNHRFIDVQVGPHRYVAGEETAVIARVSGHLAKPRVVPPRPFQRGVDGLPTLVHNVETLAHTALIARFGAGWFRAAGTDRSPGTTLLTVSGAVRTPGVLEASLDTTVAAVVERAGGTVEAPAAVLLGGYFGRWVAADRVWARTIDAESLRSASVSLGAGVLVVVSQTTCGVTETDRVLTFLATQTARQCGPCHVGLPAIAETFHRVATGKTRQGSLDLLTRWASDVRGRGACRHPDGAMLFLASAMDVFAADLRHHLKHGECRFSQRPAVLPVPATDAGWW
jgi:NADH:ubiquinone oxidoreductase subunit F (NADH-binding)